MTVSGRQVNTNSIPQELRDLPQWVLWVATNRDGKPTKIPKTVAGSYASVSDPKTWATFDAVRAAFDESKHAGIGFVFSAGDPYTGIDLDGCRNPETGEIAEWARVIIEGAESYAEVSPSGSGVKLIVRAALNQTGRKREISETPVSSKTPAIEVYDRSRFFAITGRRLRGMDQVKPAQELVDLILETYFPAEKVLATHDFRSDEAVYERARKYVSRIPGAISGQGGSNVAFHVACVLTKGFALPEQEATAIFREWNETCVPPWSEREIKHKITDAMKASGEVGYLRNASPANWDRIDVPKYAQPKKAEQSPPSHQPTVTLLADAAIKYAEIVRSGTPPLLGTGISELDYSLGGGVEPGEMVIVAARPSHGKSAVALQMVHHWTLNRRPCVMISEEMSALSLGKRTLQFASEVPVDYWDTRPDELYSDAQNYKQSHSPCYVVESCRSAEVAAEQIAKHVRDHGVKCAVVDYAQLLSSPGKGRYEQVTNTSIVLKKCAVETGVTLVLLCQLNREIEKRTKFVPVTSDLKESGQLEQDADVIIFLVWPYRIDQTRPQNEYMFFVAKNKNRPILKPAIVAHFSPGRQRIEMAQPSNYEHSFEEFSG